MKRPWSDFHEPCRHGKNVKSVVSCRASPTRSLGAFTFPVLLMKRVLPGVLAVCALAFAGPAAAHPVPFSYLDVRLDATDIDVSLVVHMFDLAHDLKIEPADRLLDPAVAADR